MTNNETINWHDYKPGDVQSKLHRLFRHSDSEEVDNMSVRIGTVITFPDVKPDKAQVMKIAEECMEVFAEWQILPRGLEAENCSYLVAECADLITAICNLLAALGVDDMRGAMAECEQRNRERGRL